MKRLTLAIGALLATTAPALAQHYDVLIRGGTLYDGTGAPARTADVAITGDRIAAVGSIPDGATATPLIDAAGRIVATRFIDPHSHAPPTIHTTDPPHPPPLPPRRITPPT